MLSFLALIQFQIHVSFKEQIFFALQKAAANEEEGPSLGGLEHNVHFARFCRKLEGVETIEHKECRRKQIKEKFLRAVEKAKIIGKGLAKHPEAKMLREFAWLEALSLDHRYGFDLQREWMDWQREETNLSFDEWRISKRLVGSSPDQVKYLNKEERKQYEVIISDGLLIRDGKPLNTSSESTIFSGKGIAIYVVSPEGQLYVGSHNKGKFHHSSFLSGAPVKGGGEIQTDEQGQIIYLSPKSGHYNPGKKELLAVLEWLQEKGVNLKLIQLCVPSEKGDFYYHNAEQFLGTKGNLAPDGIEQATFERNGGQITAIHQHSLHGGAANNRDLLKNVMNTEELDLSKVVFKEDTPWGDVFSYNALEYFEQGNLLPKQWEGGELVNNGDGSFEIRILKPRSPNEGDAIEKDMLVLNLFALKGIDLSKASFTMLGEVSVNALTYMEHNFSQYMEWREEKLRRELEGSLGQKT